MAKFKASDSPTLISRKIWQTEKFCNCHTVNCDLTYPIFMLDLVYFLLHFFSFYHSDQIKGATHRNSISYSTLISTTTVKLLNITSFILFHRNKNSNNAHDKYFWSVDFITSFCIRTDYSSLFGALWPIWSRLMP